MKFNQLDKNLQEAFNNLNSFYELYFDVHRDGEEIDAEYALDAFYKLKEYLETTLKVGDLR